MDKFNWLTNNAILFGVLTYVLTQVKSVFIYIYRMINLRIQMSVSLDGSRNTTKALEVLKELSEYPNSSKILNNNIRVDSGNDKPAIGNGLYIVRMKRFCWAYVYTWKESAMNEMGTHYYFAIYLVGFGRKEIIEKFRELFVKQAPKDSISLILGPSLDIHKTVSNNKNKRVFGSATSKVDAVVDKFIASRDLYHSFDKTYKTTIMLHGKPGTGKTSMIKHVANRIGTSKIYYIGEGLSSSGFVNRSVMTGEDSFLSTLYTDAESSDNPILCVIEDIDRSVLRINTNASNKKDKDAPKADYFEMIQASTLNNLMQFLDSNLSPHNMILIITTNNPDVLPEQLTRAGRIDHAIEVGDLTTEEAIEMCKYYNVDTKKIIQKDIKEYNPAELELKIFSEVMQ